MSERVDMVAAIYAYARTENLVELYADEAWARAGAAAFGHMATEDFEFVLVRGELVANDTYRGVDGFFDGMRAWLSEWASYTIEVEEFLEHADHVVALTHERGRSRAGGVPVSQRGAVVYTFRDAKIAKVETYLVRAAAFDDLGLGPGPADAPGTAGSGERPAPASTGRDERRTGVNRGAA